MFCLHFNDTSACCCARTKRFVVVDVAVVVAVVVVVAAAVVVFRLPVLSDGMSWYSARRMTIFFKHFWLDDESKLKIGLGNL